ncbi:MAG: hypothetical protein ACLFP2_05860 [Candidatus Woesearchaeota archaeon]
MRKRLARSLMVLLLLFFVLFLIGIQGIRHGHSVFGLGINPLIENLIILSLSIVGILMSFRELILT